MHQLAPERPTRPALSQFARSVRALNIMWISIDNYRINPDHIVWIEVSCGKRKGVMIHFIAGPSLNLTEEQGQIFLKTLLSESPKDNSSD